MTTTITGITARDIRFPTSRSGMVGSDPLNRDPDYSAAYVVLETDAPSGLEGHGITFTLGGGTEVCLSAIHALAPIVIGQTLEAIVADMAAFWRRLTQASQLRWLGPEKGVMHLATAALVNAIWDLYAKAECKPLWKLVVDMTPEHFVSCIDFSYIIDAITPDEALALLQRNEGTKAGREEQMRRHGYPAYISSAGWFGYTDEEMRDTCRDALAAGWSAFKIFIGENQESDRHRAQVMREAIGPSCRLMLDGSQGWEIGEAIEAIRSLADLDPWWIEEPTNPDDILGHAAIARAVAPIRIATGEQAHNRVMFKQLLQAGAIGICQIDSCRLGGVNEVLAVLLLAAKFGVPVCPHAGGVGLCEYVQHLSLIDYIAVSGSLEGRYLEFIDTLHEHFVEPVAIREGHYVPPTAPGYSITMRPESLQAYAYPNGRVWQHEQVR